MCKCRQGELGPLHHTTFQSCRIDLQEEVLSPGLVAAVRAHGNGKGKLLCRTKLAELVCCLVVLCQHPWSFWTSMGPALLFDTGRVLWHWQDPAAEFLAAVGTRIMDLMHPHAYPSVNQKPLRWFLWRGASPAPNGAIHKNPITLPGGSVDAALALGGRSQPGGVIPWTGGKNQPSGLSFLILSMLPALNHGNNYPRKPRIPFSVCMEWPLRETVARVQETQAGCPPVCLSMHSTVCGMQTKGWLISWRKLQEIISSAQICCRRWEKRGSFQNNCLLGFYTLHAN